MTTILVNHNGKPQPAQIVNIFAEYVKVLFADGSKAYLARTPDGRGTSAPASLRTASRAKAVHAMLCNLDKVTCKIADEEAKATTASAAASTANGYRLAPPA